MTMQNVWADAPSYTPEIWGLEASCRNMGGEWVNPTWNTGEVARYWISYWGFQKEAFNAMCGE